MSRKRIGYFENKQDPENICSRCRMCELICAFHHHAVGNPRRARITDRMNICPTGALHRPDPEGMVEVREDHCIGCAMCVNACPVGAMTLDPIDGLAAKCDLCQGEPQCILYCPAKVLKLTDAGQMARHRMKGYAQLIQVAGEGS